MRWISNNSEDFRRPHISEFETGIRNDLKSYFGASLLSSVGSLPLHLSPLIVSAVVASSIASIAEAGWITSALLIGQLCTSLLLPTLKVHIVRRDLLLLASMILLTGVLVSGSNNIIFVLAGWFCVGLCCGILKYFGTMAAVQFPRRSFAFTFRLGLILILAGVVSALLLFSNVLASYHALTFDLVLILVPILTLGNMMLRVRSATTEFADCPVESQNRSPWTSRSIFGFITLYLFFVGQIGFFTYVIQQSVDRGLSLQHTIWSMSAMKFAAGIAIFAISIYELEKRGKEQFLLAVLLLNFSILVLSQTQSIVFFVLGFLLFEISLNSLSARLQSEVVRESPNLTGRWLTGVILLGAATGPPLNGLAILYGMEKIFVSFVLISATLPFIWQQINED